VGWVLLTAVLLINIQFLRQKLVEYQLLTQPVSLMEATIPEPIGQTSVLFLNLPQWFDSQEPSYPVGVEFVSMLGGYLFVEELVDFNLSAPVSAQATILNEQFSETAYAVGLHDQTPIEQVNWGQTATQHIFLTRYEEVAPITYHMGFISEMTTGNGLASFGPYTLRGATAVSCDGVVTLQSEWQHEVGAVSPTLTLFVQGLNEAGQLVAQADGPPLGIRPDLLQTERPYTDLRQLSQSEQIPNTVLLGVYDFVTGERMIGLDREKRPLASNAISLPIISCDTATK
jgi:hypothetical protein